MKHNNKNSLQEFEYPLKKFTVDDLFSFENFLDEFQNFMNAIEEPNLYKIMHKYNDDENNVELFNQLKKDILKLLYAFRNMHITEKKVLTLLLNRKRPKQFYSEIGIKSDHECSKSVKKLMLFINTNVYLHLYFNCLNKMEKELFLEKGYKTKPFQNGCYYGSFEEGHMYLDNMSLILFFRFEQFANLKQLKYDYNKIYFLLTVLLERIPFSDHYYPQKADLFLNFYYKENNEKDYGHNTVVYSPYSINDKNNQLDYISLEIIKIYSSYQKNEVFPFLKEIYDNFGFDKEKILFNIISKLQNGFQPFVFFDVYRDNFFSRLGNNLIRL